MAFFSDNIFIIRNVWGIHYIMGKRNKNNLTFDFNDIYWFLIDSKHIEPAIINANNTKLKLILTGQIIAGKDKDFDLSDKFQLDQSINDIIHSQEENVKEQLNCNHFLCLPFDNIFYYLQSFHNSVSFFDTVKSKIARDFFRPDEFGDKKDPHFKRYTAKDYADLATVLEKLAKNREKQHQAEEKKLQETLERLKESDSYRDF